jgi:hypothetical protein
LRLCEQVDLQLAENAISDPSCRNRFTGFKRQKHDSVFHAAAAGDTILLPDQKNAAASQANLV